MNTLKALGLSVVAAAIAGTSAHAQTVIHVAGSTAFRGPATAAILDYIKSTGKASTTHGAWDLSSKSLLGPNASIIADGTIGAGGTATLIFECAWTGSVSGCVDLVAQNKGGYYLDPSALTTADISAFNNSTVNFGADDNSAATGYGGGVILVNTNVTNTTGSTTNGPNPIQGALHTVTAIPDFIFSDVSAKSAGAVIGSADASSVNGTTKKIGNFSTLASLAAAVATTPVDGGTGAVATAKTVGVVPFQWVAGNISASAVSTPAIGAVIPTNMTQQTADTLLTLGQVSQSFFSGANGAADINNQFFLVGRNEDSGTRVDTFAEAQFGVTAGPQQYQATASGTTLGSIVLYPAAALNTEPNIVWSSLGDGHTGYVAGSSVGGALALTEDGVTAANTFLIGYMGVADAATKAPGAHLLTYNGVPFSIATVDNGEYSFWSFEHLYRLSTLSGAALTAEISIANQIYNTGADIDGNGLHNDPTNAHPDTATNGSQVSGGILIGGLNVNRPADSATGSHEGGYLGHN